MSQENNMPTHLSTPNFQHIRHAPSASPPISNGVIPMHHRQHTPQPQMGSRPASRNDVRRASSNLVPPLQQVTHAPQAQNGYAYGPNPTMAQTMYNPHTTPMPTIQQPVQQPQFIYGHHPPPPQHPQVQQAYLQDQRRQSMPPAFPQQERMQQQIPPPQHPPQPPQLHIPPQQRHTPTPPQPEPEQNSQELQPQPKSMPAKSRSIFTPIDDSRSLLAQHWGVGSGANSNDNIKVEKDNRSQSVDIGNVQRANQNQPTPPPTRPRKLPPPQRNQSISSLAGETGGAKRPKLNLQIPSEQSDEGGSATAASSPGPNTGDTPAKTGTDNSHSSAVVLPPPSPSASALLSAGASGPPNPFARPHPPMNSGNQSGQSYSNNIETPISALPSRFVDGLLPSPSAFYQDWNFGRSSGDSNMLPSPLNFQTPVVSNGPSFLRDEDGERKRKSPEGDGQQQQEAAKRAKV